MESKNKTQNKKLGMQVLNQGHGGWETEASTTPPMTLNLVNNEHQ